MSIRRCSSLLADIWCSSTLARRLAATWPARKPYVGFTADTALPQHQASLATHTWLLAGIAWFESAPDVIIWLPTYFSNARRVVSTDALATAWPYLSIASVLWWADGLSRKTSRVGASLP